MSAVENTEHLMDGVTVRADNGRVYWMDDWCRCDELVQLGYLKRTFHGPATYGACTYEVRS